MYRRVFAVAVLTAVLTAATPSAAQDQSQRAVVRAPVVMFIWTWRQQITITHDESDNDQPFPTQRWFVGGTARQGMTVTFETDGAFAHISDPSAKRDAELELDLGWELGSGEWTATTPGNRSNYAAGNAIARVTPQPDGAPLARFDLRVRFITESFGTFPGGTYSTTVVGTITEN